MKYLRLLCIILIFLPFFLAGCMGGKIDENMSEQLPEFEYITQDNEKLSLEDMKGKWWLASFVYTNCTTICPVMTENMVHLQEQLKDKELNIEIVSFSVDPEYDTPDILKQYAVEHEVDFSNWTFLTGYDFATIQELSVKTFKTNLQKASPGTGNDQIAHGTSFFLVNPKGKIVKKYDGVGDKGQEEAVEDVRAIQ